MSDAADREYEAWALQVLARKLPAMRESAVIISIVPSTVDSVKFSVQLGLAIMMEKPIIVVAPEGRKLPPKLKLVADYVIEADLLDDESAERVVDRIRQISEDRGWKRRDR